MAQKHDHVVRLASDYDSVRQAIEDEERAGYKVVAMCSATGMIYIVMHRMIQGEEVVTLETDLGTPKLGEMTEGDH